MLGVSALFDKVIRNICIHNVVKPKFKYDIKINVDNAMENTSSDDPEID